MHKRYFLIIVTLFLLFISGSSPFEPLRYTLKTVVIDPGHGGRDPGNLGTGRYKKHEKDVVLAISKKLGKYIQDNFENVKVLYTRDTDKFVGLKERADFANKNNADIFICVHANSNKSSAPYGTNTFVMGLHKSKANLEVAKRENATILMEEDYKTKYEGYDPNLPEANIVFSMYQDAYLEQRLELAAKVQMEFKEKAKRRDRGVRQAGFLVLHQTTMPSILVETGFLTNKEEEKYLNSENGQDLIASAIYRAFKSYKIEMEIRMNAKVPLVEVPLVFKDDTSASLTILFRVQVVTSSNQIPLESSKFEKFEDVYEYVTGGWYKYTVGKADDLSAAYKIQAQVREKGFASAFVVAFRGDERIPLSHALKVLKKD